LTSLRVCTCSECRHVRVPAPRHAGAHCNSGQLADTPSSGPRAGRSSRADRRRPPAARPRQTTPPPPPLQHAARAHMRTTSFRMPNIITPSARARPRQHNTRTPSRQTAAASRAPKHTCAASRRASRPPAGSPVPTARSARAPDRALRRPCSGHAAPAWNPAARSHSYTAAQHSAAHRACLRGRVHQIACVSMRARTRKRVCMRVESLRRAPGARRDACVRAFERACTRVREPVVGGAAPAAHSRLVALACVPRGRQRRAGGPAQTSRPSA